MLAASCAMRASTSWRESSDVSRSVGGSIAFMGEGYAPSTSLTASDPSVLATSNDSCSKGLPSCPEGLAPPFPFPFDVPFRHIFDAVLLPMVDTTLQSNWVAW
jgi:hypothetical protein